ncbi:sn-glycerol-3-phosphate ABC transporter permease UgpA [Celerinatantimonas yamalensis]|uniref:sn-glycerol-3-phosphate transport system permease protein UgpA n=1 Tax=Celerinatantimonas yamalensis TaxID=559956 RepID=A0ABW9GCD0_9GAMM
MAQSKSVYFKGWVFPALLLTPQLLITWIFFIWPAAQAMYQSTQMQDAFGITTVFVGWKNFINLFTDPLYYQSMITTLEFSFAVSLLALAVALYLACQADKVIRGKYWYQTLLIWPYAIAPVVAGVMWLFLLKPHVGILGHFLNSIGIDWNPHTNGSDAMWMVVIAATWKQISYNFLFFLAGLQSIPRSLIEAAAIDGAGPTRRFWNIIFPLLSPTSFFLLVMNLVYAFFDTFGLIDAMTQGGPGNSTDTLVYKVFADGYIGLNIGSSAAQSVILMLLVAGLTVLQFKYVEKKVAY